MKHLKLLKLYKPPLSVVYARQGVRGVWWECFWRVGSPFMWWLEHRRWYRWTAKQAKLCRKLVKVGWRKLWLRCQDCGNALYEKGTMPKRMRWRICCYFGNWRYSLCCDRCEQHEFERDMNLWLWGF